MFSSAQFSATCSGPSTFLQQNLAQPNLFESLSDHVQSSIEYHNHNSVETSSLPPASPIVIDSVHGTPVVQEPSAQMYPDFLGRPPDDNDVFGSMSVSNPVDKLQLVDAWRQNGPSGVGAGSDSGTGAVFVSTDEMCRSFIPSNSPLAEMPLEPAIRPASKPIPIPFKFAIRQPTLSHSPFSPSSVDSPAVHTPGRNSMPLMATVIGNSLQGGQIQVQPATTGLGIHPSLLHSNANPSDIAPLRDDKTSSSDSVLVITGWQPEEGEDSLMSVDIAFDSTGSTGACGNSSVQDTVPQITASQTQAVAGDSHPCFVPPDTPAHDGCVPMDGISPIIPEENRIPQMSSSLTILSGVPEGKQYVSPRTTNMPVFGCLSNILGQEPVQDSVPLSQYDVPNDSGLVTSAVPDVPLVQPTPISFMFSADVASTVLSSLEAGTLSMGRTSTSQSELQVPLGKPSGDEGEECLSVMSRQVSSTALSRTRHPTQSPTLMPPPPPKFRCKPPSLPSPPPQISTQLFTTAESMPSIPTRMRSSLRARGGVVRDVRSFVPLDLARRITQRSLREMEEERVVERRRMEEREREEDEVGGGGRGGDESAALVSVGPPVFKTFSFSARFPEGNVQTSCDDRSGSGSDANNSQQRAQVSGVMSSSDMRLQTQALVQSQTLSSTSPQSNAKYGLPPQYVIQNGCRSTSLVPPRFGMPNAMMTTTTTMKAVPGFPATPTPARVARDRVKSEGVKNVGVTGCNSDGTDAGSHSRDAGDFTMMSGSGSGSVSSPLVGVRSYPQIQVPPLAVLRERTMGAVGVGEVGDKRGRGGEGYIERGAKRARIC